MNERIKQIRAAEGMSQQKFADQLKIARGNIAAYEVGKNAPSDAVIALICKEFSINEEWLRTGQGEMKREMTREQQIMDFASGFYDENDDSFKKRFVLALTKLNSKQWEQLNDIIKTLLEN